MTDEDFNGLIAGLIAATNPRDAYLDAQRRWWDAFAARPLLADRKAAGDETERHVAQLRALQDTGKKCGLSDEDLDVLYHASRGRESPNRKSDPERIAKLAADIYKLVYDREVLIAEGTLALYLALNHQVTNCGCGGCNCGDMAHERATKELRGDIGTAAIKLFDVELEALGW